MNTNQTHPRHSREGGNPVIRRMIVDPPSIRLRSGQAPHGSDMRSTISVYASVILTALASVVQAQNSPRIGYVYPAGGRQGDTFQVVIGGRYLDGVSAASICGRGMQATVVEHVKPLTMKQVNELREKLKELQAQRGDREALKQVAEIRKKLAGFNRDANPAIAETVTLEVTAAPDAEPGRHELRLCTTLGLTNPLVFYVGQLAECCEQEPQRRSGESDMSITLPTVVNGQIMPGDVDRFRFQAHRGQRLVATVSARELMPYLADAVPGWFQAVLAVYDAGGKELAYDDDYRFQPDPVLCCEIPEDGEYTIEIRDSIYRGREDFVYRLSVGELPFITSIFPLGGRAGTQTSIQVTGWNLPANELTVDAPDGEAGLKPISVQQGTWVSNCVPFAVDTLPECLEKESNNAPRSAQLVRLPVIVNGRIDSSGDSDVFRFEGRAGDKIVAEAQARRFGSPVDSVLTLTDAEGRQLAFNDDHEDKGAGLTTHHADSWLCATLPADGAYYVHLSDAQSKGGAEYAYRLRIGPPRPDFDLRLVPSSINVRAGVTIPILVYAMRKDGFSGDISLALKDAPEEFVLSGGWVPAGQDSIRVTLTIPSTPPAEPVSLNLEGRAVIDGREVVHPVVPADDMMQAFFYQHLVPARELEVAVLGQGRRAASVQVLDDTPIKIPAGGTAPVRLAAPRNLAVSNVQLELNEPPKGVAIRGISPIREGIEIVLTSDASEVKPGLKGNLIVNAFSGKPSAAATGKPQRRASLGTLPAIPFEIVEP
jgi:hypothetical protein